MISRGQCLSLVSATNLAPCTSIGGAAFGSSCRPVCAGTGHLFHQLHYSRQVPTVHRAPKQKKKPSFLSRACSAGYATNALRLSPSSFVTWSVCASLTRFPSQALVWFSHREVSPCSNVSKRPIVRRRIAQVCCMFGLDSSFSSTPFIPSPKT